MINFDYQIIRRPRRKTAAITVKPDCSVQVLVPSFLPEHTITALVEKKGKWVREKIAYFKETQKNHKKKEYVSGEIFSYLGRKYRLRIVSDDRGTGNSAVKLKHGRFHVSVSPDISEKVRNQLVKEQLIKWYMEHALEKLREKTLHFAALIGVVPVLIGVKNYRSRWGTCYADGRIYYNWQIIMAPQTIIDYVVVHELCHLMHANHSKKYWQLVTEIMPDHAKRKQWIKDNGSRLRI